VQLWITKPFRAYFATVIVTATAVFGSLLILALLTTDSAYLRYQFLERNFPGAAQWIYERIHFDNRPLDVVVIGSSNAMYGINSVRMEEDLKQRGLSVGVANFSLIIGGRNLNYVILKEMFDAGRYPKLLVLGVSSRPAHFGHPAFKYIAEPDDIIGAVYPINLNYFRDLSYLPIRKLKLIAAKWFPNLFDVRLHFDRSLYQGSDYDPLKMVRNPDGSAVDIRQHTITRAALLKQIASGESGLHLSLMRLPAPMAALEFGDEYFYVPKIAALAQAHGTKMAFLYVPQFQGPPKSLMDAFYGQYGPVFDASFVSDSDQLFADTAHLNNDGRLRITDWFVDRVTNLIGAADRDH
jgi:hypothetical protein